VRLQVRTRCMRSRQTGCGLPMPSRAAAAHEWWGGRRERDDASYVRGPAGCAPGAAPAHGRRRRRRICMSPPGRTGGTGAKPIVHAGGTVPLDNILLHSVVATPVPV
jgi:hypothetical protein